MVKLLQENSINNYLKKIEKKIIFGVNEFN